MIKLKIKRQERMNYKDMKFHMLDGGNRGICGKGCGRQNKQLNAYDWLAGTPGNIESTDLVEVQFKNTRKGYYHNMRRQRAENSRQ